MDFIYSTLWLWLFLAVASFFCSSRKPRLRPVSEPILGIAGILFMGSLILHFLPRLS